MHKAKLIYSKSQNKNSTKDWHYLRKTEKNQELERAGESLVAVEAKIEERDRAMPDGEKKAAAGAVGEGAWTEEVIGKGDEEEEPGATMEEGSSDDVSGPTGGTRNAGHPPSHRRAQGWKLGLGRGQQRQRTKISPGSLGAQHLRKRRAWREL